MSVQAPTSPRVPMDVAGRMDRLRGQMAADGLDALLVTSLANIRYLTGFSGSAGLLVILPGSATLVTDGRYADQSVQQLREAGVDADVEIAPAPGQAAAVRARIGAAGVCRLGLEAAHVSWAQQRAYEASWSPHIELVPTVGVVEVLRQRKDAGEIARLAAAADIADRALGALGDALDHEPTEAELAAALDAEMRRLGAADRSFETIVASGPNAAMPHHRPGSRQIRRGEVVVVDFGALVEGYHSDMTRTLWAGELADPQLRRAVRVVTESQEAGVAAVRAGVECVEVDRACREVVAGAGWGERFVHGTGHGVGLDIHEAPAVSSSSAATLQVGHVITVEPGVYLPGVGGVRIEDTVVVTDRGCYPLTTSPKERC